LITQIGERWPDAAVVGLIAEPTAPAVLRALRAGACEVIGPRDDPREVGEALDRALATSAAADEAPQSRGLSQSLVGQSEAMVALRELVARAAQGSTTVLIRGESGTGKEVVARALHAQGDRAERPFVKVHCAGLPETLLESELFGHERGAFTGAVSRRIGRVEVAGDGTLFLDEIGELTPLMQTKLLLLLQDGEYQRLGSNQTLESKARFVAATHRDLKAMIQQGRFREDLFYRLNVISLWLPPLRGRRGDVELLARRFFDEATREAQRPEMRLEKSALDELSGLPWPGNVRQLRNTIERLVAMAPTPSIGAADVRREMTEPADMAPVAAEVTGPNATSLSATFSVRTPLDAQLMAIERRALVRALERAGGSKVKACKLLGIGRTTLYMKLAEHGLE
jgi:two-component system response regulator AtoC